MFVGKTAPAAGRADEPLEAASAAAAAEGFWLTRRTGEEEACGWALPAAHRREGGQVIV